MAVCSTCGNEYDPDDKENTHPYRHPVNGVLPKRKPEEGSPRPSVLDLPMDPVLRLVLIRKGLIEPLDLTEAEQELAATGMAQARSAPETGVNIEGVTVKGADEEALTDAIGRLTSG